MGSFNEYRRLKDSLSIGDMRDRSKYSQQVSARTDAPSDMMGTNVQDSIQWGPAGVAEQPYNVYQHRTHYGPFSARWQGYSPLGRRLMGNDQMGRRFSRDMFDGQDDPRYDATVYMEGMQPVGGYPGPSWSAKDRAKNQQGELETPAERIARVQYEEPDWTEENLKYGGADAVGGLNPNYKWNLKKMIQGEFGAANLEHQVDAAHFQPYKDSPEMAQHEQVEGERNLMYGSFHQPNTQDFDTTDARLRQAIDYFNPTIGSRSDAEFTTVDEMPVGGTAPLYNQGITYQEDDQSTDMIDESDFVDWGATYGQLGKPEDFYSKVLDKWGGEKLPGYQGGGVLGRGSLFQNWLDEDIKGQFGELTAAEGLARDSAQQISSLEQDLYDAQMQTGENTAGTRAGLLGQTLDAQQRKYTSGLSGVGRSVSDVLGERELLKEGQSNMLSGKASRDRIRGKINIEQQNLDEQTAIMDAFNMDWNPYEKLEARYLEQTGTTGKNWTVDPELDWYSTFWDRIQGGYGL